METPAKKPEPIIICGYQDELSAITQSRSQRGGPAAKPDPDSIRALCLSGGGIRSATFACGVINCLAEQDGALLRKVDYLSTVSGGGYLGSFVGKTFQSYGAAANQTDNAYHRLSKANSDNLGFLRRNGRYLANNGDEAMVALATFIRNTIWLHLMLVPMLMLLFVFAFMLRLCFVPYSYHQPFAWLLTLEQNIPGQMFIARIPYEWMLFLFASALYLLSIALYFLLAATSRAVLRALAERQGQMAGAAMLFAAFALMCDLSLYIYHKADSSWLSAVAVFNSAVILFAYKVFPALNKLTERFRSAGITAGAIAVLVIVTYLVLTGITAIVVFERWTLWQAGYFLCFLAMLVLLLVINQKYDYINRTTLHAFYSARLRRAYLGAANPERINTSDTNDKAIVNYHPKDDCAMADYQPHLSGGPIHLINVTVNRNLSPNSKLWQPDRQGCNLAISAISVSNDDHVYCAQNALSPANARSPLTLAQWVAISGAAASTGMGRLTSWYSSVITALLNVRLGYWWKPQSILTERFYRCFYQEFTNRYTAAADDCWYLSDGGHFENLAVYEMIKRRVPRIMLLDAGQDKAFAFDDLANLVRHARIDFHYDFTVATAAQRETIFPAPSQAALIGEPEQLKNTSQQRAGKRACLLIGRYTGTELPLHPGLENRDIYLLYIKPTLTGSEPLDVGHYFTEYPDFPHESTADQFFDEPQWESYRKLGYHTATELREVINSFLS